LMDAHIHLDLYNPTEIDHLMQELPQHGISHVVAVSVDRESCRRVQELHRRYPGQVVPAYGQHPERSLPPERELHELFAFIREHREEMAAIGEVGLPYYTRKEAERKGGRFDLQPYLELLEEFVRLARELDKPIVLHAVHEDADLACDLLEKHSVSRAHFHWFKGGDRTVRRIVENGYHVSFTPDIVYEAEIRELAKKVPIGRAMAETDGPWPFEGPFLGQRTHPRMVRRVLEELSSLKKLTFEETDRIVLANTKMFYGIR